MDLDCESVEAVMKSDDEMTRDRSSGTAAATVAAAAANHSHFTKMKSSESRRMVDITRDKPIKVAVRVVVPVRDHPKFNFVGKLLGPKGNSLKRLQEDTMCKMAVLGRGSMKDRHKEEELRASGDPKFQHLSEELHVEISAFATPAEAHARIAYALAEVRRFLVPDYNDDIRQEQMWEMQVLSSQRNNNKGDELAGGGADYQTEDRLSSTGNIEILEVPDSPTNEDHPALRGVQPVIVGDASTSPINSGTVVGGQVSPNNGAGGGVAAAVQTPTISGTTPTAAAGRKRPLLAGGPRTSMTPTKRTVMSLLARARAAQAKQLPTTTFQRAPTERSSTTMVPLLREDYLSGTMNLNLI
ncbi:PREDICTED: KH domain-containing, RNA-binding, signal transduction-associated protein 2-like [Nicrophorus vespilloides]|uniref:KH domain-containing, RNA-binding, signal transduction-associated protein 2-like n=1 Tax=Nicrophorus vespilloides TaxID=110193 RepID=A0ABM1NB53_NICVS|nr:PREDICTED: KH domain-containing, RNA-binding, signal transduction-associated protein 2-like [Nicrophorus vespilloides]XP_017784053.1 PREDICTED: KH domain-containing, RNA-binding, signal transduction-associated protein 2-like [Nicrophorus vespilloides]XP_017784054.1 PREDICTED: KH domain-containing, RNA-binding, signal transduction-associated protein 2-like [Nicrophorus vespilloides]XP_017784055.1 PREDICTED: KH domain-containing, RNA-binding, signal transduction-associated protein 2-like [Nicro